MRIARRTVLGSGLALAAAGAARAADEGLPWMLPELKRVDVDGHSIGPVAHAVGGGLRFDVAWFAFVERTLLRVDIAKAINSDSAVQVWLDVQVPF